MDPLGPRWLPPTPEELVAKCPFDGHSPYNDQAKAMLGSGTLLDTREIPAHGPEEQVPLRSTGWV